MKSDLKNVSVIKCSSASIFSIWTDFVRQVGRENGAKIDSKKDRKNVGCDCWNDFCRFLQNPLWSCEEIAYWMPWEPLVRLGGPLGRRGAALEAFWPALGAPLGRLWGPRTIAHWGASVWQLSGWFSGCVLGPSGPPCRAPLNVCDSDLA